MTTTGRGLIDITAQVRRVVTDSQINTGLCQVFVHHTSASLLLNENCDPEVCADLERFMQRQVPDGDALFEHTAEGPDDMPAHVRAALTGVSQGMPVTDGQLALGTWQGLFLWEHRHRGHQRRVTITVMGDSNL